MKTPIEFANEILSDKEPYALKIAKELRQSVGDRVLLDQAAQCLENDCTYLRKVAKSINEWAKGEAEESFRSPVATAEKSSVVGDAAKLREVLKELMDNLKIHAMMPCQQITMNHAEVDAMIEDCRAALAAPARNCDRPECATLEMATKTWIREEFGPYCNNSKVTMADIRTFDVWIYAPATKKEGGNNEDN